MKWFTKSRALGVFMISLVLVVTGIRGDEENRADAGQDPFEKVTLADDGGVRSSLFGHCLAASRTLEGVLYSIELPSAPDSLGQPEEFIRYVPDSWQLAAPAGWKTATSNPPVAKIEDCAAAAHSGGNAMFKYSGGSDCKVSNKTYDLKYTPACDAEERDAVFILNSVDVKCPLPGTPLVANKTQGTSFCYTVHTELMSYVEAGRFCAIKYDGGRFQGPNGLIGFNDIVQILKDRKVESSNFIVATSHLAGQPWKWYERATDPIDPALMAGDPPTTGDHVAYMKGSADFKLDFAPEATFRGGVVCWGFIQD